MSLLETVLKLLIRLDKKIFGPELFYSVEDGHKFEVPNFINIICNTLK